MLESKYEYFSKVFVWLHHVTYMKNRTKLLVEMLNSEFVHCLKSSISDIVTFFVTFSNSTAHKIHRNARSIFFRKAFPTTHHIINVLKKLRFLRFLLPKIQF